MTPRPLYRRRPVLVWADQLTEVKEIETSRGTGLGRPGDWRVETPGGRVRLMSAEEFELKYEAVEPVGVGA